MIDQEFLRKVPLFAGLPDRVLADLATQAEEVCLVPGEVLFSEAEPGDMAYVITAGEMEVLKEASGGPVLLAVRGPGEVIGEMALLEAAPRMATVRAQKDSRLLAISKDRFEEMLSTDLPALRALFQAVLERWRGTEAMLRQSNRMAQLGTLTAGIAHELNNPSAAVQRAADQLREAVDRFHVTERSLAALDLTHSRLQDLDLMSTYAREQATRPPEMDALARSDMETDIQDWLDDHGVEDSWKLSPALVDLGYNEGRLQQLAGTFGPAQIPTVVAWLTAFYTVHHLLAVTTGGAERLSAIVKALKSYVYLDQAPVQTVNLHEGLDESLLILRHKLRGISVRREYGADVQQIEAHGAELNQVWTNLLDNAADALGETGQIIIRTRRERDSVVVEIEDNGPGIPEAIQPRIFDPFFTTKPPGKGTGLGLEITHNIVAYKHRGTITVESEPGRTCFRVTLPTSLTTVLPATAPRTT